MVGFFWEQEREGEGCGTPPAGQGRERGAVKETMGERGWPAVGKRPLRRRRALFPRVVGRH